MKSSRKPLRVTVSDNLASMRFYSQMAEEPNEGADSLMQEMHERANKPKRKYTQDYSGQTESQIQKEILAALKAHPSVAWCARFNSSNLTLTDETGANRYVRSNTQRGMSDLMGMLHGGRLFAIEVKSRTGTVHDYQEAFLQKIRSGGGIAGVARSVEQAVELLK